MTYESDLLDWGSLWPVALCRQYHCYLQKIAGTGIQNKTMSIHPLLSTPKNTYPDMMNLRPEKKRCLIGVTRPTLVTYPADPTYFY